MNWPPGVCLFLSRVEVIPQKQEMDYISQNPSGRGEDVAGSCVLTGQTGGGGGDEVGGPMAPFR